MKLPDLRLRCLLWIPIALQVGCGREVNADAANVADLMSNRFAAASGGLVAMVSPVGAAPAVSPESTASVGSGREFALTSTLYSERDAEVGARVAGVVAELHVELGDAVRAGQLLATLRDEEESAAVESARAAHELARLEHERATGLEAAQVITRAEIDQAAFRLRSTAAQLREAEVRLEYTRVRAPFDGVITRRFVRGAQTVDRFEPLFRVTAMQPLRVLVRVPELQARGLARSQSIALRSLDGQRVPGVVARIAPAVDPASGTVEVLVDVPSPGTLRPGSNVVAEFAAPVSAPR